MGEWQPLDAGTVVGLYVIQSLLSAGEQRHDYLGQLAPEIGFTPQRPEPWLRIVETPAGGMEAMRAVEALQLRHPHLLALREWFAQDEREYLIVDLPEDGWPLAQPFNLTAEEALANGVIIGDVLTFLHARGVAHLHVGPEALAQTPQGVVLAGLEDATVLQEGMDAEALLARDANMLAQVVASMAQPEQSGTMAQAIAQIAVRGAEGAFASVREVQAECLHALPDGLPALTPEDAAAPLTLRLGHATTVGRVREQNQDAIGILALEIIDDQPQASPGGLFLVADGMGGEAQGEVASRIAARMIVAEVARRFLSSAARASASDAPGAESSPGDQPTTMNLDSITALVESFRAANARIRNMVRRLEKASGTTTTALMLFGHEAVLGHIGDSRAYLVRGGEMVQLTQDHSLLAKLIELGQINAEDAAIAVPRNYLYRSLGQNDEVDIDTRIIRVGAGDQFILCSDGLWDLVPDADIKAVVTSGLAPDEAARELVRRANAAGGFDNSTAVIVQLTRRDEA